MNSLVDMNIQIPELPNSIIGSPNNRKVEYGTVVI